ncbi:DNA topoisomerase IV subunit B, partial [Priestia megaterium]|nr:DNA topoisomerase IV subunit B [Priestia megaterium]
RVRQTSFLVPGLKITVIDENIPETGDESVDAMVEVDAPADETTQADGNTGDAQPAQPRYSHARVEEFLHNGGLKDFVDFLSKGESVSDIWRITGEDTYVEETQAVGEGGELHAQKVTRDCAVDIAMR